MPIDKDLLAILVCPKCKGELEHKLGKEDEALLCHRCALRYEIDEGIPIMLIDEAKPL